MTKRFFNGALIAAAVMFVCGPVPAAAHPHVFITVETTLLVGSDKIVTGIREKWTFDDMYSAFATQGLDKDKDGKLSRDELKELTDLNVESLKEFDYFTHPEYGKEKIKTKPPIDYFLEHADGALSLQFTLPLEKPLAADKAPVTFSIYDPGYFIAFTFDKDRAAKIAEGAHQSCKIQQKAPDKNSAEVKRLDEAFVQSMGPGANFGLGLAESIIVVCDGAP